MAAIKTTSNDEELVRAVLAGNVRAFDQLVERYFGMVYAIAYAWLGHRETAEDLAQEVFLRVYLYLGNLKQPSRFSSWLSQITRNLAIDWQRRGQRASRLIPMVPLDDRTAEVPYAMAKGARERMEEKERDSAVRTEILKLPPELREMVLLHFTEELSIKEIAKRVGIHQSTVKYRIKKALATMRRSLEPILHESAPALRASKKATIRTIAIIGTAAAMSAKTKAALAAAAGGVTKLSSASLAKSGGIATISAILSLLKAIPANIATGGIIMGMGKKVAITVVAIAVLGGGVHYYNTKIAKKEMVNGAVEKHYTVSDNGRQGQTRVNYEVQIEPSKAMNGRLKMGENEIIATGVDFMNAIANVYPGFRRSQVITDCSFQGRYDIYLKVPQGQGDLLYQILQTEFEDYFGLTSRRETREMDVYILTAPKDRSPNLREPTQKSQGFMRAGRGKYTVSNQPIDSITGTLESSLNKPVINETNLTGRYDYEINYHPDNPGSIVNAICDQFDLKLTAARRPLEVLIIEKKAP